MWTIIGRRAASAAAVGLLSVSVVFGLAACQRSVPDTASVPPATQATEPADTEEAVDDGFIVRSPDRIEEQLARQSRQAAHPARECVRRALVDHPDGGYHITCMMLR